MWPEWRDDGRGVEIWVGSEKFTGTLHCDDVGFDGEDEFPIWVIRMDDGTERTFADNDSWCFL